MSDVTLATEDDGQLTAHKVILAASSPFFKRLLSKNPNPHHLLYLMGVKLAQLQQLLSYIYLGKCDLTQEQLPAFMAIGKQLEIEGLSRDLEESKECYSDSKIEIGPLVDIDQNKEFVTPSQNEDLDTSENGMLKVQQTTSQVEGAYKDFRLKETGDNPSKSLRSHTSSHTSALKDLHKGLKCNQCDYQASRGAHLRQHKLNVHEGLKYSCTSCDYKSGDKSNLKRHVEKEHLGVSYTCEVCKHVCSTKGDLKRHVNFRHNGLRYECFECDGVFGRKGDLNRHVRSLHKGVII